IIVITQSDSPFAMRIAHRETTDQQPTPVLITSLDDKDSSDDILLRLTKRRLFPLRSWEIVKALFQAQEIDPRLTRYSWIAESLLNWIPTEGYAPVSGGFLDAETVWPILLRCGMNLTTEHPDLQAVLRWSIDVENVARYRAASTAFQEAATQWLAGLVGPPVVAILDCVARSERTDALPIGLAAAVVFHPNVAGRLERAVGKLEERYLRGVALAEGTLDRWSAAATEVVRLQLPDAKQKRQQLLRADEILAEVGAETSAYLSDTSPLGFDQRLASFGRQLTETLGSLKSQSVEHLTEARRTILSHDLVSRERRRLERVDMAVRLIRWISKAEHDGLAQPQSLAEAAAYQVAEGSFVDWARLSLRWGDPVQALSEAYAQLVDRVTEQREEQAHVFATLLKDWTAAGSTGAAIIPVENVLELIVAPLASQIPILVVVVDGMSTAVWRELVTDITQHDWVTLSKEGQSPSALIGLAAIPSLTEVSRASLLCGQLRRGNAQDEQAGFASHPALLMQCRTNSPPILFHKASLQEEDDAGLASEVRKEIASSHRCIVGVVINAVDDYLLKGEQLKTSWTQDQIKVLRALLHEAHQARRVVVVLSDHGHVLDYKTAGRAYEGGDRWRRDNGAPADKELQISGSRVLVPESHALIAPWTERLRYGIKKNGYHGGVTPQEMVVPIGVLCSTATHPKGWSDASVEIPPWWDEPVSEDMGPREAVPLPEPSKRTVPRPSGPLFDWAAGQAPAEPQALRWISALVASPLFAEQKKIAGRAVPSDDIFTRLLVALDSRGGKMTSAALARALDCPAIRLRGLLAITQRVLNIDGYAVLTRDEASDTVELNRELLRRQFDLISSA
ncbi:MAG: BREX-2 system phosphatase PglZ, partial [Candidatus Binatia bacterium]